MLEPPEQIVVLVFLVIVHLDHVVVELGKHVEICKCQMISNEESSTFQMLLQMFSQLLSLSNVGLDICYLIFFILIVTQENRLPLLVRTQQKVGNLKWL